MEHGKQLFRFTSARRRVLGLKVSLTLCNIQYSSLRLFCSGLSSVTPTTSRVEADFSFINYRKDDFNSTMSDIALEGVLFARQRKDLEILLNHLLEYSVGKLPPSYLYVHH